MKKYITPLMLISLLLMSCKDEKTINENSSITIIFKNPKIEDTIFYSNKLFVVNENQITYRIDNSFIDHIIDITDKEKIIKIKTSKPIFLNHHYYKSDHYLNYYCFYPNDTLTFEYKDGVPFVTSKKNKEYNYNFGSIFNSKNPTNFDEILFFKNNKRFKNENELKSDAILMGIRELKQIKFYDSLKNKNLISKTDYNLNLSLINNKKKLNSVDAKAILSESVNLADIGNSYMINTAFEKIYPLKFVNVSDGRMPNFKEQFENALSIKDIESTNRDFLLFSNLDNIAKRGTKEDFIKCYNLFQNEVENETLKKYFKDKYDVIFESNNVKNNNEVLLFDLKKNKKDLNEIIKANKGKIIYIDFWASWCAPCRVLLPSSINLHNEYKNKGVVFIYVSIDDDFNKWQKASIKEKISTSQYNFLAINYSKANLFKKLELKTVPRYILYNKKGELVNSNAPNPNSKEIKKEFEKYLKD